MATAWWDHIGVANDNCRTAERCAQLRVEAAHDVIVSILRAESSKAICLSITSRLSAVASRAPLTFVPLVDGQVSISSDIVSR